MNQQIQLTLADDIVQLLGRVYFLLAALFVLFSIKIKKK